MEGDQAVLDVLVRELKRAKQEIVVDVWREEASLLREPLAEAEARESRCCGLVTARTRVSQERWRGLGGTDLRSAGEAAGNSPLLWTGSGAY